MKQKESTTFPKSFWEFFRLPLTNGGFTLIEILVVVLIIGILGAIALPQYQRAVLKSRFAALMPIAKSMADSNEAFYLEHGEYADNAEDLPIQGRRNYTDGTELEFGTLTGYSYVLATRDNDFPNNYIVYQKHSEQFPGEIHCEAAADNTQAQEVCKSFGPTQELGETLTPNYLTYVLFGTGNGVAPSGDEPAEPETPTCEGVSCDEDGNITECASGLTLNNGECVTCDIPNATSCSTTSYAATSCKFGYIANEGICEEDPRMAAAQAMANQRCVNNPPKLGCTGIPNEDGTITVCENDIASVGDDKICHSTGYPGGRYAAVYTSSGTMVGVSWCISVTEDGCGEIQHTTINGDVGVTNSYYCTDHTAISDNLVCASGSAVVETETQW